MKIFILILAVALFTVLALGGEPQPLDFAEEAYRLSLKDMGKDSWAKHIKKIKARCEDYVKDIPGGSIDDFMDDRLCDLAREVGDIESLKKFTAWLGAYYEFGLSLPDRIEKKLKARERDLKKILDEFSWEKLLALVNKEK